ncbi:lipid-binding SYLF domain-containing protein [Chloracidobacterium thermophilum]|uniref:lipid-binding SYLF domain-containing protein n=1 Tax=Chloracidobacterium thermophilum TaxID=458033 RepID=UPI0011D2AC39|nr:lipid-binding SYLF domain-containing protein [Chloracidobacterium thermophilum]QUV79136.1 lipid-binding SYLF domain-containing protein [Chloracidobacterium thermophilum]
MHGWLRTVVAGLLVGTPLLVGSVSTPAAAAKAAAVKIDRKVRERLDRSAEILTEIMRAPDQGLSPDFLRQCEGLVFIPGVKKGALIVGGQFGRGVMVVRQPDRQWGPPGFVTLGGGSFGLQIGGQSTDVILLVMNRRGIEKLASNKFKLGADASVAAGPVGRDLKAGTDIQMQAEILSYSRSQGVFAGLSLEGATLQVDDEANKAIYGRTVASREVVEGTLPRPKEAARLYAALRRYAG